MRMSGLKLYNFLNFHLQSHQHSVLSSEMSKIVLYSWVQTLPRCLAERIKLGNHAAIDLSPPQRFRCYLRLRVFHTAVRYGKRHVKLIETSAEERGNIDRLSKFFSPHEMA